MVEKQIIIRNKMGLHARPAALLVQTAAKYNSRIKIVKDGQEVDGKSIMGLMTLAANAGSTLTVIADGTDENDALVALEKLFDSGFGE